MHHRASMLSMHAQLGISSIIILTCALALLAADGALTHDAARLLRGPAPAHLVAALVRTALRKRASTEAALLGRGQANGITEVGPAGRCDSRSR